MILQVLSHNLCTVLCIPHDPVALEEHFRDDDDGPVSSQGYMPYLNKYILDKVIKKPQTSVLSLFQCIASPMCFIIQTAFFKPLVLCLCRLWKVLLLRKT